MNLKEINIPSLNWLLGFALSHVLSGAEGGYRRDLYDVVIVRDHDTTGSFNYHETDLYGAETNYIIVSEARPVREWAIGHEIGHIIWRNRFAKTTAGFIDPIGGRDVVREIFCDVQGIVRFARKAKMTITANLVKEIGLVCIQYSNWRDTGRNGTFCGMNVSTKPVTGSGWEYSNRFKFIYENFSTIFPNGKYSEEGFMASLKGLRAFYAPLIVLMKNAA